MTAQSTLAIRAVAHSNHDVMDRDRAWRAQYGARPWTPEETLCFAVLQDAIWMFCRKTPERHWKGAKRWLTDKADWGPFSFNVIWDLLYPACNKDKARRQILAEPELVLRRLRAMAGCNVQGYHKRGYEPPEAA